MIKKNFFEKHYKSVRREGIFKSALYGLLIGSGVNFLVALAEWIFDFGSIWIAIGVGVAVTVISGIILYFLKFSPKDYDIARRVDRLGLEERLVTMLELQNDDSYIATLQREDAKRQLGGISDKRIKLHFSKPVIALTIISMLLGISMTTVVGLTQNDIIPPALEIVNPEDPMSQYVSVSYIVEEGGEIIGEQDQLIFPGSDASTVVAMPEDGWMFMGWDDGEESPERTDKNITENVEFVAIFVELSEGEGIEGGDGGGDDGAPSDGEGDQAQDAPTSGGSGDSDNDAAEDSDSNNDGKDDNNDSNQEGQDGNSSSGSTGADGIGGNGKWEDSNQFIDGNTYYKDQLEMYYQWAKEIFEQNGEIPPELREFFEKYFDSI